MFMCCCSCEVFSDNFNRANSTDIGASWTEVAGDWSIASNTLSIATTSAKALCSTAAPGVNNYQVIVTVVRGGTDIIRVFVDYTDSSNWHCGEVSLTSSVLRIIHCVAGVETILAELQGGLTGSEITVCIRPTNVMSLSTGETQGGNTVIVFAEITPTATGIALGTGATLSSAAITFDNFAIEVPDGATCQACYDCDPCGVDSLPFEMQVDITDLVKTPYVGGCTLANCDTYEGTFVCQFLGNRTPAVTSNGACIWRYIFASPACAYTHLHVSAGLNWQVTLFDSAAGCSVSCHGLLWGFSVGCDDDPTPTAVASTSTAQTGGNGECNFGGTSTATLTAL